jgi:hypothetical protein
MPGLAFIGKRLDRPEVLGDRLSWCESWRAANLAILRRLAWVEQRAIGGAGPGCAADRMLRRPQPEEDDHPGSFRYMFAAASRLRRNAGHH